VPENDTLTLSGPWANRERRHGVDREESLSCWSRVLIPYRHRYASRYRSVGIETRYGMGGPGIESLWGWDFPHPSSPTLGSIGSFLEVKRLGRVANNPAPSGAEVKYVYSCNSTPPLDFRGLFEGELYLYLLQLAFYLNL